MRRALACALILIAAATLGTAGSGGASLRAAELSSPLNEPIGIAPGPDASVWVTDAEGIVRVGADGRMRRIVSSDDVSDVAPGPDGSMWFTGGRIGRFEPGAREPEYFQLARYANVIVAGPDGNMWFTEDPGDSETRGRIARITPDGEITEFGSGLARESQPNEIGLGPDGNLWFTDVLGRIGRATPAGVIKEYAIRRGAKDGVSGIAPGPDGAVWFGVGPKIGRITTDGRTTLYDSPFDSNFGFARGPDGHVWVTGYGLHGGDTTGVARIGAGGRTKVFTRGFTRQMGLDLTLGPGGRNLWVLEWSDQTGYHVARFSPAAGATEFPPPPPCRVPPVARKPLRWVRVAAADASCGLDRASRRSGKRPGTIALSVRPRAGTVHPAGTPLHVEFGPPPPLPKRCTLPFGARRETRTSRLLVYSYEDYDPRYLDSTETTYGACLRSNKRHRQFESTYSQDVGYTSASGFEARGHFVAYALEEGNHYGDYSVTLNVFDVARGRRRYQTEVESHYGEVHAEPGLGDYAVSRHGAVAWFELEGSGKLLHVRTKGDEQTLDQGRLDDLRFDGDTLRWTHGGAARHAVP